MTDSIPTSSMLTASLELHSALSLFFTPNLGPVRVKALLEHFGSAARALESKLGELREVNGLEASSIASLTSTAARDKAAARADAELERARKVGAQIVAFSSDLYPEALRAIYDPPPVLWIRGDPAALEMLQGATPRAIGIVGTRKCSPHARAFTQGLAGDLAAAGVTVNSGLARGIDTAAHAAAVDAGGGSIAVLGCGIDTIYPAENKALAERLTVVSGYAIGTPPAAHNFPARNRIIAGLSSGIVVVEGDLDSGSLITAVAALENGRTVFAVPGRPNDPNARGPNRLIKQGAALIESAQDILEEFRWGSVTAARAMPVLDGDEATVYAALEGELLLDDLVLRTGLGGPQITVALMMLTLKNVVLELPGGRYSRA
jgi:DNA processing protein